MAIEPMKPIYLPKRQLMENDEDYDTGIVQNEENLNQNLNRLYTAVYSMQEENEALRKTITALQAKLGGKS
ncbi:MAG: hypothetical protein J6V24_10215 [Clostridia bacterium]|nr:hypothetical protein [Clostridia bacterium]